MSQPAKSVTLTASWKGFIWQYITGFLLLPVLIGFYLIWKTVREHRGHSYVLTDRDITVIDPKFSDKADLADIQKVEITNRRFGTGTLIFRTRTRSLEMKAIENPEQIKEAVEKAIRAEKERRSTRMKARPQENTYDPGSMDGMEYLTGLWQQGLITDEEYRAQKRNFE